MSEDRRTIAFYSPRIQIPIEDIQLASTEYGLYCLPVEGAEMLVRIAPYLQRVVTFVHSVVTPKTFLGPTSDEMGVIDEIVAETIEGLIMACDLEDLISAIEAQTTVLSALQTCVCNLSLTGSIDNARLPDVMEYRDMGQVTYNTVEDSLPFYTDPFTDGEKCTMAQAFYAYVFEMFTEILLPAAEYGADALTAAAVAAVPFEGLAGFLGIPVAILSLMVASAIKWAVDGSVANFTNWLWANKEEIICRTRRWLPDKDVVSFMLANFVDSQEGISYLDKAVLKTVLCSQWHLGWVIKEQDTNGTWNSSIISGYCTDCDDELALYWTGSPCSTATLLGDCGTNDCRHAHSGGYVASPNFVLSAASHVVFAMRLENSSIAGSFQINIFNYSTSLSVFSQDVDLDSNEERWEFFETDLPGGTYNVRIHAVGGVDCDVFRLVGEAIPD